MVIEAEAVAWCEDVGVAAAPEGWACDYDYDWLAMLSCHEGYFEVDSTS